MVDTRVVISPSLLSKIHSNESLKELLMRNWLDIKGLRQIVSNIVKMENPKEDQFYAQYRMTNAMFLKVLREKYSPKLLKDLSLHHKTNSEALGQLLIISSFFASTPFVFVMYR
jgi:hypothetical protein